MVELKCDNCQSNFYLNNVDKYTSKLVSFKCKNCGVHCSTDISGFQKSAHNAEARSSSNTEIVEFGNEFQIAKIMILDSEIKLYLTEGEYAFGRSSDLRPSIIHLPQDTFLSRQHFVIIGNAVSKTKFEYRIKDNNSKNGTWLNEKRLDPTEEIYLQHNDVVRAGETMFAIVFEKLNISI